MSHATPPLLNEPPDVARAWEDLANRPYHATRLREWSSALGCGTLEWARRMRAPRTAFNQVDLPYQPAPGWEFPPEYPADDALDFSVRLVSPRTVRLRWQLRPGATFPPDAESPMLAGPVPDGTCDPSWRILERDGATIFTNLGGFMRIERDPFHVEFYDPAGRLLTRTLHPDDNRGLTNEAMLPFAMLRRAGDLGRQSAAAWQLSPGERIYGAGESFTRLDKRGQRLHLWTCDTYSALTDRMYKPVPFFLSNRGYGMFVHASTPMTFDFGRAHDGSTVLHVDQPTLDLFVFIGDPRTVLREYTALTGRAPMPPLWSFGLWMSRYTYRSETEVREVADKLREHAIPCDVLHLDTGWFETEWRCNYQFSPTRFPEPAALLRDLRERGLRVSLWQLPYLTPTNDLFREVVDAGLAVAGPDGGLPTDDAVLDFANPATVTWFQARLAALFDLGVAAIKTDFGEEAPAHGRYANGHSGHHEHNLYPLRYQAAAAEVTQARAGHGLQWTRAAWAGAQRYPVHWGGDPETNDAGMAASLRGGLSLGLCGFTFWSHDMGGFSRRPPRALYRRWIAFGVLCSHSRTHGVPPREPWHFDADLVVDFRRAVELKYRLLPYIYAQSVAACAAGLPLLRPLFLEYPLDPGSWLVEDQYLLGPDLLVAPMFEDHHERQVYLPPGSWIDYQTHHVYRGPGFAVMRPGLVPICLLVREGAILPHLGVAAHTGAQDWTRQDLVVYRMHDGPATTRICLPPEVVQGLVASGAEPGTVDLTHLHDLRIDLDSGLCILVDDPYCGQVTWSIRTFHAG